MRRIKVCGITRIEDARLAVDLGAAALGFVFWPRSPRAIDADRARAIVDALPALVATVGVFVNQPVDEVASIARQARLTTIQLHGDEDPAAYADAGWAVIKAVPVSPGFDVAAIDRVPAEMTVLLDAHDPVRRGGTGQAIDWELAASAARRRPVILSGGLRPDTVGRAVEAVRPYALDVSSGVESSPGMKDETKLRAFFAAVQS